MGWTQGVLSLLTVDPQQAGWDATVTTNFSDIVSAVNDTIRIVASTETFDINTTTAQTLFTVPSGYKFVFVGIVVREPTTSAAACVFQLGSTGTSVNSILVTNRNLTNLTSSTRRVIMGRGNVGDTTPLHSIIIAAGDVIQGKLNTAAGSAGTAGVDLYGYLVPV